MSSKPPAVLKIQNVARLASGEDDISREDDTDSGEPNSPNKSVRLEGHRDKNRLTSEHIPVLVKVPPSPDVDVSDCSLDFPDGQNKSCLSAGQDFTSLIRRINNSEDRGTSWNLYPGLELSPDNQRRLNELTENRRKYEVRLDDPQQTPPVVIEQFLQVRIYILYKCC